MNYQKIYEKIIDRAKNRELTCYKEKHHILPRCLGGTDDKSNLVDLTPEEHYLSHQLLLKMHPNNPKLVYALIKMSGNKFCNNKLYGWIKKKLGKCKAKERVIFKCKQCGIEQRVQPYYIKMFTFCGYECRSLAHKNNTQKLLHKCVECNCEFIDYKSRGIRKFCSSACKYKNGVSLETRNKMSRSQRQRKPSLL
jgi:hypothetical protein